MTEAIITKKNGIMYAKVEDRLILISGFSQVMETFKLKEGDKVQGNVKTSKVENGEIKRFNVVSCK